LLKESAFLPVARIQQHGFKPIGLGRKLKHTPEPLKLVISRVAIVILKAQYPTSISMRYDMYDVGFMVERSANISNAAGRRIYHFISIAMLGELKSVHELAALNLAADTRLISWHGAEYQDSTLAQLGEVRKEASVSVTLKARQMASALLIFVISPDTADSLRSNGYWLLRTSSKNFKT
jgi:hypothetical protein